MANSDQCLLAGGNRVHFLDASEEEVVDLVRSLLLQLRIMASCLSIPPQQTKILRTYIAIFEDYLNRRHPTH